MPRERLVSDSLQTNKQAPANIGWELVARLWDTAVRK